MKTPFIMNKSIFHTNKNTFMYQERGFPNALSSLGKCLLVYGIPNWEDKNSRNKPSLEMSEYPPS